MTSESGDIISLSGHIDEAVASAPSVEKKKRRKHAINVSMNSHSIGKALEESQRKLRQNGLDKVKKVIDKQQKMRLNLEKYRKEQSKKVTKKTGLSARQDAEAKLIVELSKEMDQWCSAFQEIKDVIQANTSEHSEITEQLLKLTFHQYRMLCRTSEYRSVYIYAQDPVIQSSMRDKFTLT